MQVRWGLRLRTICVDDTEQVGGKEEKKIEGVIRMYVFVCAHAAMGGLERRRDKSNGVGGRESGWQRRQTQPLQ